MAKSLEEIELEFKAGMQGGKEDKGKEQDKENDGGIRYRFNAFRVSEIIFYVAVTLMVLCTAVYFVDREQPCIGGYVIWNVTPSQKHMEYSEGSLLVLKNSNTTKIPAGETEGEVVLCIPYLGNIFEKISKNLGGIILLFFLLTSLSFVLKIYAVKLSDET